MDTSTSLTDSQSTAETEPSCLVELVSVVKHKAEYSEQVVDKVAVEAPLEIRVNGVTLATLMRTPGADFCLVRGFLITESVISSLDDVEVIEFPAKNQCLVILNDEVEINLAEHKRYLPNYGSCGVCSSTQGASLDSPRSGSDVSIGLSDLEGSDSACLGVSALTKALAVLNDKPQAFKDTGGIHAAGLFSLDGELLQLNEDIGRHNAVDKVIGAYLAEAGEDDFSATFLLVSSRLSYEIVQKSIMVGIPLVAALSAPSSLAIDLAIKHDSTVIGFLRPPKFNLYHEGQVKIACSVSSVS